MSDIPKYYFCPDYNFFKFKSTDYIDKLHNTERFPEAIIEEIIKDNKINNLNDKDNAIKIINEYHKKINENVGKLTDIYMEIIDNSYDKNMDVYIERDNKFVKENVKNQMLKDIIKNYATNNPEQKKYSFSANNSTFPFYENFEFCEKISYSINQKILENKEKYKLLDRIPNFYCQKNKDWTYVSKIIMDFKNTN